MGSVKYNFSIKAKIGVHTLTSSLGTKSQLKAEKVKHKVDEIEFDARLHPELIDDYIARFWLLVGKEDKHRELQSENNPLFLDLFKKCYTTKVQEGIINQSTYTLYQDFEKNLVSLFEQYNISKLKFSEFSTEIYDKLMLFFQEQDYSPTTKNMRLRLLRAFYSWCLKRKYIGVLPFEINKVREPVKETSFLYPDQFHKIMSAIRNVPMKSYLYIYRATGLRRREIFNVEEIVRSNGTWLIVKGKGNKERVVEIPTDMLDHWEVVKANPYKPSSITRAFVRACQETGIKARLHDLRHTFAFTQIAQGIDPYRLQVKMGHTDFKTTQVYLRTDRKMLMDLLSDQSKIVDDMAIMA